MAFPRSENAGTAGMLTVLLERSVWMTAKLGFLQSIPETCVLQKSDTGGALLDSQGSALKQLEVIRAK